MRIAITSDPMLPIPPREYGGVERVIHMLVRGLVARGHDVTLFARAGSEAPCRVIPYPGLTADRPADILRNMLSVSRLLVLQHDVVHSFGRLAYLLPLLPLGVPKIMSYQRAPTVRQVRRAVKLSRKRSLTFTGCSDYISRQISPIASTVTVYNGVQLDSYSPAYEVTPDAPLAFLGRIERIKGVHVAIAVAKAAGRRLVIAGNAVDTREGRHYYETEVRPHLHDPDIQYVGAVDDRMKNELLRNAAALLMPVEWDEPFGIVMAEALACGTPVLGFARGAVPEVIEHGVTGFLCDTLDEMTALTHQLHAIDRRRCRESCRDRFSDSVVVDAYERLYRERISAGHPRGLAVA